MAARRLPIVRIKRALHLYFEEGCSQRESALRARIARGSLALFLERLTAAGFSGPEASRLSDLDLDELLYPKPPEPAGKPHPDWEAVERRMDEQGVTRRQLWEEWRTQHPDGMSYPSWCRHYRAFRWPLGAPRRKRRRRTRAR